MSKRTLQRILDVCSASVRKPLQGLDNFSAQGYQAFDDLAKLTDNLVDCGKPPEWARDVKQHLRSSKQYLKGDYKVRGENNHIAALQSENNRLFSFLLQRVITCNKCLAKKLSSSVSV